MANLEREITLYHAHGWNTPREKMPALARNVRRAIQDGVESIEDWELWLRGLSRSGNRWTIY